MIGSGSVFADLYFHTLLLIEYLRFYISLDDDIVLWSVGDSAVLRVLYDYEQVVPVRGNHYLVLLQY